MVVVVVVVPGVVVVYLHDESVTHLTSITTNYD